MDYDLEYEDYFNCFDRTKGEEIQKCGECGNKVKVKDSYPKRIKIGKQPAVTKAVCKSCFNK